MSFLSRLIERHVVDKEQPMPVLAPRLPSRFEPPSSGAGARLVEAAVGADATRLATPAPPPVTAHAPAPRPAAPPDPRLREVRSALAAAQTTIDAPLAATSDRANAPIVDPVTAASPSVERVVARTVSAAVAVTPVPPAMPAARRDPRSRPMASRTKGIEPDATHPDGAPTIHVSIGRVEVRAVTTATPPPPRPRPAAARPSLEDYLRGRSRGSS